MVRTMKQSEYVYVVTVGDFEEFPEYSETRVPKVFTDESEAVEYFDEITVLDSFYQTLYEAVTDDFRVLKVMFVDGSVSEYNLVKCPALFDAYQFGGLA